jgi:hypothetical protein
VKDDRKMMIRKRIKRPCIRRVAARVWLRRAVLRAARVLAAF